MLSLLRSALLLALGGRLAHSLRATLATRDHNLNTALDEDDPLKYNGTWGDNHVFMPSPDNWRFPVYTLFLDKYVNGNPNNDDANGTVFEQDVYGTQLRYGGDLQGLTDSLDYIRGMGIGAIYIAGSPFINLPWAADSYSVCLPYASWAYTLSLC
jgi:alpha-1,3-glucan synthase